MFGALGRFDYRFRRWIPVVALLLVIGLQAWSSVSGGSYAQGGWTIPDSESIKTEQLLADRFGTPETLMFVVYHDPAGDAASTDFQATVTDSMSGLEGDAMVDQVITYTTSGNDPSFISTDGTYTYAVARLTVQDEEAVADAERLSALVGRPAGVDLWVTGVPQVYHEFNQEIESDLRTAELVSLPIAAVILLIVFGTFVAAGLPLAIAGFSLASTLAVVALLASISDVSVFVTNLATMIGLALAIDYSLFMVSRFREELLHHPVPEALERMMASVGKAVTVSGIAVAIGLASLTVFQAPSLRSMGWGGVITVLSTLLFGLTVLPALLAMLGHRVNRLRIPVPQFLRLVEDDPEAAERRHGRGIWSRIAVRVMKRPLLIGLPVLLGLLVLGLPFRDIQLSTGGNLEDLPDTPAREGFLILRDEFAGGDSDPMVVAVTYSGADLAAGELTAERLTDLSAYIDQLKALPDVTEVKSVLDPPPGLDATQYQALLPAPREAWPPGLSDWVDQTVAGDTTKLTVFSKLLPDSDAGRAQVDTIRAFPDPPGAETGVTGLAARSTDFMASFYDSVPVAVLIVIAVTLIVLFLTFGSVFLPVKAVLMSLVSITASFGALVFIFQEGHFQDLLGFEASGAIGAWLPIMMFAILFGLSMDYEVFLLSRIRERYAALGENTAAVAEGIGVTGGIITGAAVIMVVVFGAFALSQIVFLKALGFSMALAVLIDATIVRGILVPAFMRVMGRWNWWAPRWLQRGVARLGLYEGPVTPAAERVPSPAD